MDINNCTIQGRLIRNPEQANSKNGEHYVRFSIANNRFKDKVNFFECIAYGKKAEVIARYCTKGTKLIIIGELERSKYQEKDYYTFKVNDFSFADTKKQETPANFNHYQQGNYQQREGYGVAEQIEEEIPF